jgi:hypothetical protein
MQAKSTQFGILFGSGIGGNFPSPDEALFLRTHQQG